MATQSGQVVRWSCERCFSRKVKCDKDYPCHRCKSSGIECIQRLPAAPRRRRREEQLLERLNRANKLLREHDRSQSATTPGSAPATTPGSSSQGKLFKSEGNVRFVDNDLWNAVGSEFPETVNLVQEHSSEADEDEMSVDGSCDLIMGLSSAGTAATNLASFHPAPPHIRHLWLVFLENVNPLSKLVHCPTTAVLTDRACDGKQSLDKADEVLLFAIYLSAVVSMTVEECRHSLGESRATLSQRYQRACREALVRAKFLRTSSLQVLAGFVMYLQALRNDLDSSTFWTLTGVASRIAQGLGLHQYGADLGLSIFDTEMRTRVWWQVLWLEFRSAERTGSGYASQYFIHDIRAPRNIDDVDFWPGQTEQELEDVVQKRGQNRATEMMNVLILCENGTFWREQMTKDGDLDPYGASKWPFGAQRSPQKPWEAELSHRNQLIDELESRVEEKYIRYCDPSIPSQLMASIHIRGGMAYMRLMTHHPRRWPSHEDIPPEQRELLWKLSMRILDLDALQRTTPSLQKFAWKFSEYFHWQALVYVLQELRKQPTSDDAVQGFARIHEAFRIHPAFVADRISLHLALCSLALKVWDARVAALQEQGMEEVSPPYIETLIRRRSAAANKPAAGAEQGTQRPSGAGAEPAAGGEENIARHSEAQPPQHVENDQQQQPSYFVPMDEDMEHQPDYPFMGGDEMLKDASFMDWDMWDTLIQDFQQGGAAPYS